MTREQIKNSNTLLVEGLSMEQWIERDSVAVRFGRWLLKHAEPVFNEDGLLCWNYGGGLFDTHELYPKYLLEEFGINTFNSNVS